jgi:Methyltransferase domain
MSITTLIKNCINAGLKPLNLRIDSRTAERAETDRLAALVARAHFTRPVFPVLRQFVNCDYSNIREGLYSFRSNLDRFRQSDRSGYRFQNEYFPSPDAEVAYVITRTLGPKRILEVGAGNSTLLFREAINDAGLPTKLIAVDPSPRNLIEDVTDRTIRSPVEQISRCWFQDLLVNDILFIDSTHRISTGNDVVHLILSILPSLRKGVVVHLHDIFLPYEYPQEWVIDHGWGWNEQYLVQALLQGSSDFEVLWPGYFLQKTWAGFADLFDYRPMGTASSLWLRKIA